MASKHTNISFNASGKQMKNIWNPQINTTNCSDTPAFRQPLFLFIERKVCVCVCVWGCYSMYAHLHTKVISAWLSHTQLQSRFSVRDPILFTSSFPVCWWTMLHLSICELTMTAQSERLHVCFCAKWSSWMPQTHNWVIANPYLLTIFPWRPLNCSPSHWHFPWHQRSVDSKQVSSWGD